MAIDQPADEPLFDVTDLPMQPTGSGVADVEIARMQAEVADESAEAGIADETAAYDRAMPSDNGTPTKMQA